MINLQNAEVTYIDQENSIAIDNHKWIIDNFESIKEQVLDHLVETYNNYRDVMIDFPLEATLGHLTSENKKELYDYFKITSVYPSSNSKGSFGLMLFPTWDQDGAIGVGFHDYEIEEYGSVGAAFEIW